MNGQRVTLVLDADQVRYLKELIDADPDSDRVLAATFRSVLQAQEEAVTKKPQRLTWDAVEGASSYDVVIDEETEHGWTVKSFSPSVYLGTRPFKTVRIRALSSSGWIVAETFRRTQFIRGAELAVLQRPS